MRANTRYIVPALAEEPPTARMSLDLLSVNGGTVVFSTTVAYVVNLLRSGLRDVEDADLTRIAELYHLVVEEVRERKREEAA